MTKQHVATLVASMLVVLSGAAHAQGMTSDQHSAAKKAISAAHDRDKAQCDQLQANAKDVCKKEADAKEDIAKAELAQQYKPSPKNQRDVEHAKAKGAYEVAKEKCDDQAGEAKRSCEDLAKADYEKAKADIKASKP